MYWNVLVSVAGSDGTPRKIIGPIDDREEANQLGLRLGIRAKQLRLREELNIHVRAVSSPDDQLELLLSEFS